MLCYDRAGFASRFRRGAWGVLYGGVGGVYCSKDPRIGMGLELLWPERVIKRACSEGGGGARSSLL